MSPVNSSMETDDAYNFLKEYFKSTKYINILKKLYDDNVYNWANEYSYKTNYYPLKQHYALLAIAITLFNLSLNEKYLKNFTHNHLYKDIHFNIFNYLKS